MNNPQNENEYYTVTLNLDEGDVECAIYTTFHVEEQEYIALLPLDENGDATEDVYFYRFKEAGEDSEIENIEDEDELLAASEAFDEWLEEQELLMLDADE